MQFESNLCNCISFLFVKVCKQRIERKKKSIAFLCWMLYVYKHWYNWTNSIIHHFPYPWSVEYFKALKMSCAGFVISSISQALFGPLNNLNFSQGVLLGILSPNQKNYLVTCFDSVCKWPVSVGSFPLYYGCWMHQNTWHTLLHPSFTYLTYVCICLNDICISFLNIFCGAIFVLLHNVLCISLTFIVILSVKGISIWICHFCSVKTVWCLIAYLI